MVTHTLTDKVTQEECRLLKSAGNCSPALAEVLKSRGYVYEDQCEEAALVQKLQRFAERERSQKLPRKGSEGRAEG